MNGITDKDSKKDSAIKKKIYSSAIREKMAQNTRAKIKRALVDLFQSKGLEGDITFKAVALKAGVTEMTVYRYCPERNDLLKILWEGINDKIGGQVGLPNSADELLKNNPTLHRGFEALAPMIVASITTQQGRDMRASIHKERQKAFTRIVQKLNPSISKKSARSYASILQLLHSAYAWDSLRCNWEMSDEEIVEVTQNALRIMINHVRKGKNL